MDYSLNWFGIISYYYHLKVYYSNLHFYMPPRALSLRIHSKGLAPVYVSMPSLSSRRDCSQTSKCWYGSNPDLDWMAVFSKLYSNARWMAGQRRRDSSFLLPYQQHDFPAKYRPVGRLCYRIVHKVGRQAPWSSSSCIKSSWPYRRGQECLACAASDHISPCRSRGGRSAQLNCRFAFCHLDV